MGKKREPGLDLIRVIAICAIAAYHYFVALDFSDTFFCVYANGDWGSTGTCIFFVLSGYLLAYNDLDVPAGVFYKKRFMSIFPLMDLMFLSFYVIYSIYVGNFMYGGAVWKLLLSLLGIDGYLELYGVHTYYVVVGEWFTAIILLVYLLFPALRLLYRRCPFLTTAVLGLLYFINIAVGLQLYVPDAASVFTGIFLAWIGMLICRFKDQLNRTRSWIVAPAAAAAAVLFAGLPAFPGKWSTSTLPWADLLGISLFLIMLRLFSDIDAEGRASAIFRKMSGLSFGVYLCHHFLVFRFKALAQTWVSDSIVRALAGFAAVLALSFAVSWVFTKAVNKGMSALRSGREKVSR